jgi:hypothetical protein
LALRWPGHAGRLVPVHETSHDESDRDGRNPGIRTSSLGGPVGVTGGKIR